MTSLYTDHDDIRDVFDSKWLLQLCASKKKEVVVFFYLIRLRCGSHLPFLPFEPFTHTHPAVSSHLGGTVLRAGHQIVDISSILWGFTTVTDPGLAMLASACLSIYVVMARGDHGVTTKSLCWRGWSRSRPLDAVVVWYMDLRVNATVKKDSAPIILSLEDLDFSSKPNHHIQPRQYNIL